MPIEERFWTKVDRSGGGCWEWLAYKTPRGYGKISKLYAHRVSYALENGTDPAEMSPDLVIRHTCDNPGCVNPAHLLPGTHADNVADRFKRGDGPPGYRDPNWKRKQYESTKLGPAHEVTRTKEGTVIWFDEFH